MSSRTRRAGTATPLPGTTSTPVNIPAPTQDETAAGNNLSPTCYSRLLEKRDLQNLNDRLATYIDRVRSLETDNARLYTELQTYKETETREVNNIKSMFESELNDARRLLDETSHEKAKLEIDAKRLWEENESLKKSLDKKSKDCKEAENSARINESRVADLSAKLNAAKADKKKAVDELTDLRKECENLRRQLEDARASLAEETLARVDLENCIQSLREELVFKDQVHMQEVNETRVRRTVEISEIDGRLSAQYEDKLQRSLQELRAQYEAQMKLNREDVESFYQKKISNLENALSFNSSNAHSAEEEIRTSRKRIDGLNEKILELEKSNAALQAKNRDLEKQLDYERERHMAEIARVEEELQRLRSDMAKQMQEYQDLLDIKCGLDLEIAAYDKLLNGEEMRLNIPHNPENNVTIASLSQSFSRAPPTRSTPARGQSLGATAAKRKRTVVEESEDTEETNVMVSSHSSADVSIVEADAEGKFVKIYNKGNKEINIGGWQLVRNVADKSTTFKFHRTVKIDAGATVTVWSSNVTGITHEPPSVIVMKSQVWFPGAAARVALLNGEGEEVAYRENIRSTFGTHAARRRIGGRPALQSADDELYHQNGDPKEDRCSLM